MTKDKSQDRDRPAADPAASAVPHGSLGSWLRAQREARGVSLRDIADASKISLRYLEALEQDRLEILPAPIFTKGFLREYARVVGLDPDEVVNLYLLAAGERERESVGALPLPGPAVVSRGGRGAPGPSPLGYGLLLVLAVVVFLAVAALLSLWASRRGRPEPAPEPARPSAAASEPRAAPPVAPPAPGETAPATPSEAPSVLPARAPEPEPPRAIAPVAGPTASEAAASAASAASAPSSPSAPGPAPPVEGVAAALPPLRLVLEFTQDCWVELVVDGQRRTSELRTAGEVVALEARDFVLLTLGNSPGVRVEVDGRPFPLPASSIRVVKDLRIDRATAAGAPAGATPGP